MYICKECGEEFKSYNKNPKFCSKECKNASITTRIDIEEAKKIYKSGMTQEEVAKKLETTQKVIWRLFKKHGFKCRIAKKRNQEGDKNSYWKGGISQSGKGYVWIKCKGHPRAKKSGDYVPAHVLIIEQKLGRFLNYYGQNNPNNEVIHHNNGITNDNRIENLVLMSFAEHSTLHLKQRNFNRKENNA